ncbi:MAG TPA: hypothetical protein VM580_22295, partial [Labilithrix sp.]|nr:hypothetical protein [Labilithrix sp.]
MRRIRRSGLAASAFVALVALSSPSTAAERWVDRPMTLHRLVFAGDVGLGVGHRRDVPGPRDSISGLGMNLEG